jgi:plasmid stabilization system protein ParE
MPKLIVWSPLSEKDLESIIGYLHSNWDDKVVHEFVEITDKLVNQISNNPKQFPIIHSRKMHNTLFYRDRKEYIDILRIYDTRQDPKKIRF